jgi:hypothetical protein
MDEEGITELDHRKHRILNTFLEQKRIAEEERKRNQIEAQQKRQEEAARRKVEKNRWRRVLELSDRWHAANRVKLFIAEIEARAITGDDPLAGGRSRDEWVAWIDVLLYTGPRRGDAAVIGRQHEKTVTNPDGGTTRVVQFKTEKSGELVTVTLPILPALRHTLDIGPTGDLTWICGARGRPLTKESFGNKFSEAARQAGIKKSAHGVRKIAATIAAENGATEKELDALFGWVDDGRTSGVYTREVSRARLAAQSAHKMDETGTSMPAPSVPVRAEVKKA